MDQGFYELLNGEYDVILSDFDGTVIDSERIHAEIGVRLLNENGVPDMTFDERYGMMGYGEYKIHEELVKQGRQPSFTAEEFKKRQAEEFISEMKKVKDPASILRRGYLDFVETANELEIPIYIVSNTARESVSAGIKAAGLSSLIPENRIFAFEDFLDAGIERKPAPAPFEHVRNIFSEAHNIKTPRALALEDSQTGFLAAHAAKCDTLLIYYDRVGQKEDPRATYNSPDSLCLRSRFSSCACGTTVNVGRTPNGIHIPASTSSTYVPACK